MFATQRLLVSIALASSAFIATTNLSAQKPAAAPAAAVTSEAVTVPTSALELDAERPDLKGVESRSARARLGKAWKTYERAVKRFLKAERTVSRTSRTRLIDRAVKGLSSAVKQIERVQMKHSGEPRVRVISGRLAPKFAIARRTAQLELASSYASRGSFNRALRIVEDLLRAMPRDKEAKRQREHIQLLLSNGFGY